jgi:dipeptidyl aminopeptidase/acylaminoacyl peptidase
MRRPCLIRTAAAVAAMVTFLCGAPRGNAAPLELYGRLPNLEDVALSPDGSRIAFVRTTANKRVIYIVSLEDRKGLGALNVGEQKLREIRWADDDHLMITTSTTALPVGFTGQRHEFFGLQVYSVAAKSTTILPSPLKNLNLMNVVTGRVIVTHPAGHTVLFIPGIYVTDLTLPALFRVDLDAGDSERLVRQGSVATRDWLVNDAGDVVAEENYFESDKRWTLSALRDGHLMPVGSGNETIDYPRLLGLGPDGNSILVSSVEGGDPVWRLLSLQTGQLGQPMAEHNVLSEPIEDPRTHRMIGGVRLGDTDRYVFFDPVRQAQWEAIVRGFPAEALHLVSASDDFKKVIVLVDGARHGLLYVLVDTQTNKAGVLGEIYEGLGLPLEVRRIVYPAGDGLQIPALLTLPAGRAATRLPLIILPHGGPAVADKAGFDWWSQALAAQGYAVLRPNYRGSALSWKYMSSGFGEWGRKMQSDLSDGVRYLAKEGIVDASRVCIVGGSYGGYAALAGVSLDPDVYRCAVSIAGISDLQRFLKWVNARTAFSGRESERYWDRYMGASSADDPVLATLSPLRHIDAIKVPVLLIHGRDDTVVPFEQSDVMFAALKAAKKPVEMVALKQEDHWLSRSESRLQMLQSTVAFLRSNNPPD